MPSFLPLKTAALAAALSILASCASAPNENAAPKGVAAFDGDPRLGEKTDRACFASTIDNFKMAGDRTVVLESSRSRQHLVEVTGACPQLRRAQTIGVDSRTSCVTRGDSLIVSDSAFGLKHSGGLGPQRCLIKGIHEWDEDAELGENVEAKTDAS